jgi:hypothetical protein
MGAATTFGSREVANVALFNKTTNKLAIFIKSMKMSNMEISTDKVSARGGYGNPERVQWESNKDISFTCTDCLVSPASLAIMTGTTVSDSNQYVRKVEAIAVSGTSGTIAATAYTSDTTTYPYQAYLSENNDERTVSTELTIAATPSAGEFNISGTTVTFGDTHAAGTRILMTYYTYVATKRVEIKSTLFAGTYEIRGETLWRAEGTSNDYNVNIYIPSAKLQSDISIEMAADGDPATFEMNFKATRPSGSNTIMYWDIEDESETTPS